MAKRVLLLTGAPGVGKTTVLLKTVDALKARGVSAGGMISREVRDGGVRAGFEVIDLTGGRKGWLAHVNQKSGPRVGKYHVNLEDLEKVGAEAIVEAVQNCAVVAIDEIGPMELHSPKFKQAVAQALGSRRVVLAVVHAKANDPLITEAKHRSDAEIFTVTLSSRDSLAEVLAEKVLRLTAAELSL